MSVDKRSGGAGLKYLTRLPVAIPKGTVLVHNNVRPTRRLGSRGFRAWLLDADEPGIAVCDCGWAPELGTHYQTKRNAALSNRGQGGIVSTES